MKKHITAVLATAISVGLLASCGGRRSDETAGIVEQKSSEITDALRSHNYAAASQLADSMALYVDDLTPDETVTVLLAFLEVHNRNVEQERHDDDLETLRKYVDVYDIALDNNPSDMREAFARARRLNPELDFEKAAADFRRLLAEYDAVQTYGLEPQPAPADSTAQAPADSVATTRAETLSVN